MQEEKTFCFGLKLVVKRHFLSLLFFFSFFFFFFFFCLDGFFCYSLIFFLHKSAASTPLYILYILLIYLNYRCGTKEDLDRAVVKVDERKHLLKYPKVYIQQQLVGNRREQKREYGNWDDRVSLQK